jgi:hypothetical protein
MQVRVEELKIGSVMMTGEVVTEIVTGTLDSRPTSYKSHKTFRRFAPTLSNKWIDFLLVNPKTNKSRNVNYTIGNTIFIKSL